MVESFKTAKLYAFPKNSPLMRRNYIFRKSAYQLKKKKKKPRICIGYRYVADVHGSRVKEIAHRNPYSEAPYLYLILIRG